MTSSGTYEFGTETEAVDVFTEAFERCGIPPSQISAQMLISARRSAMFMFSSWVNNGPNLFEIYQYPITLLDDGVTTSYNLPADTIYVTDAFTRQTQNGVVTDLLCEAISRVEYWGLPNKLGVRSQRPTQYYLQRTLIPVIYPWPLLQDNATCQLRLNIMRMIQDVGKMSNTLDAPQRAFDAIASGLAHRLAGKYAEARVQRLKMEYDEAYSLFIGEDRERVPLRITVDNSVYQP